MPCARRCIGSGRTLVRRALVTLLALVLVGTVVPASSMAAPAAPEPGGQADPADQADQAASAPAENGASGGATTLSVATADATVLRALQQTGRSDFYISVDARADLSPAGGIDDWEERGAWVVDELQRTARESQREVQALLDDADATYTSFWIANTILVEDASEPLAAQLVALEAVHYLHEDVEFALPDLEEHDLTSQEQAVEWGIANIRADEVWSDVGVRGEGIVVGGIDTGVQWDHPALQETYRGTAQDGTVEHDYNWFDPAGICGAPSEPCDTQSHGTHTMGTTVGGDDADGTAIGVAPRAQWIAAKGCEATGGVDCSLASLLSSGEWMLAPTDRNGANPRPDLRPHIINNSWGGDTGSESDPFYDEVLEAWNAAGIFAAFSNGNDGANGCGTSGSPADSPHAFAVGAHDQENTIAPFSSRGPEGDGRSRPHLTAPGVMVRSAVPGGQYASANGTSMAAPHVTGGVALLWGAAPDLIGDVNGTREVLGQTAIDTEDLTCGGTAERNNVYGEGRLDIRAAVEAAPTGPSGSLVGLAIDESTGEPLSGVTVRAVPADDTALIRTTTTGPDGRYAVRLPVGEHAVTFQRYAYRTPEPVSAVILADEETTLDQALEAQPTATVTGTVADGSGQGWSLYAAVSIEGYPHGTLWTDPKTGSFEVELPTDTTYELVVHTPYEGYIPYVGDLVVEGESTVAELSLQANAAQRCPTLGYQPAFTGGFEGFGATELPEGWSVETSTGDGWVFDDPGDRDNQTGGAGGHAVVDSNAGMRVEHSVLTGPVTDLTDVAEPELSFRSNLRSGHRTTATVEVSVDAGQTWDEVWTRTAPAPGPDLVRVPLPEAAGEPAAAVRFGFDGDGASQQGWWQIDEVLLGTVSCAPVDGGLLLGQVTDDRTNMALSGATVQIGDETTTTVQTPADPELGGGFYWLFTPAAETVEVHAENPLGQHHADTKQVTLPSGEATRVDLALGSGELVFDGPVAPMSATLGEAAETTLSVTNVGTAPATFSLVERDAATQVPDPHDSEWVQIADMTGARSNGLVDVHDGTLVYLGGHGDGASPTRHRSYVYDIETDEWQLTEEFQDYRSNPVGGFVDGLMYVIGGNGGTRGVQDTVLTYDPEADSWDEREPAPYAVMTAGHAIQDDQIYLFGGYDIDGQLVDTGVAYDPADDSWRSIAPYPERAASQMCGTVDGVIYCAGGVTEGPDGYLHLARAYAYRPDNDAWFRIADLPLTVTAAGYTAANGLLMLSGGQVGGGRSNLGFYYDPAVNVWQEMPPSLFDLFGVGSGCGFYKVSGTQGRPGYFRWVEQLPGFDDCDTSGGDRLPWLQGTEGSTTVAPGETVEITLTAATEKLDQPGDYEATLMVLEDTPHRNDPLTASVEVDVPLRWGAVTGTVTGASRCDAEVTELAGAEVRFEANDLDVTVYTDESGSYTYYLPIPGGRLTATATAEGMTEDTRMIRPSPGRTVTEDFALRTAEPCASVDAEQLSIEVATGEDGEASLTLENSGAADVDFTVTPSAASLDPLTSTGGATAQEPEWTVAAPVLDGRRQYAQAKCAMEPELAYVIGGVRNSNPLTKRSWRYDAVADEWTELAQIPETSASMRAVCEAGAIHVFVGDGVDRHFVYDIARDSWSEAEALPQSVDHAAIAAWNGQVFVVGGTPEEPDVSLDTTHIYDIATGTWSQGPAMPQATTEAGYFQSGSELYVAGGRDLSADWGYWELDVTQRLDLETLEWETGAALLHARSNMGLVATDQALYTVGGMGRTDSGGRTPTDTVQRLDLSEWGDGEWTTDRPPLPRNVQLNHAGWCTTGRAGGEIWSIGGAGQAAETSAIFLPVPGETCPGLGGDVPWLTVDAEVGSVAAGAEHQLTVTVDASALPEGASHRATLVFTTTDPGRPEIRVPVQIEGTS